MARGLRSQRQCGGKWRCMKARVNKFGQGVFLGVLTHYGLPKVAGVVVKGLPACLGWQNTTKIKRLLERGKAKEEIR